MTNTADTSHALHEVRYRPLDTRTSETVHRKYHNDLEVEARTGFGSECSFRLKASSREPPPTPRNAALLQVEVWVDIIVPEVRC